MQKNRTPAQAAKQIGTELGRTEAKGHARLACALAEGTLMPNGRRVGFNASNDAPVCFPTLPKRITTKALAVQYQELCDKSSHRNGLWKGTYGDTARILRTYSRARAIYHLEKLAERYKSMSLSSVYAQAANNLREYAGGAC